MHNLYVRQSCSEADPMQEVRNKGPAPQVRIEEYIKYIMFSYVDLNDN